MNINNAFRLILLVDDDPDDNFAHERILKKTHFCEKVFSCEDGEEAIQFLTTKGEYSEGRMSYPKPDIIFLDINMPRMNGWEFLDEYEKLGDEVKGKIILIMLTTSLNPKDRMKAKRLGFIEAFINKPLTAELLYDLKEKYL